MWPYFYYCMIWNPRLLIIPRNIPYAARYNNIYSCNTHPTHSVVDHMLYITTHQTIQYTELFGACVVIYS